MGYGRVNPQARDTSWGWQTTLSYNITGEDNGFDSLTPRNNFDFFQSDDPEATGLWQVALRVDQLQLDSDLFNPLEVGNTAAARRTSFANSGNNNGARSNARGFNSYSLGFNWYLNPNIRAYASLVYTQWYYAGNDGTFATSIPQNNQIITNDEIGLTTRLQIFY